MSAQWAYAVKTDNECDLDAMGQVGWELVSVIYREWKDADGYNEHEFIYHFKRPKPEMVQSLG